MQIYSTIIVHVATFLLKPYATGPGHIQTSSRSAAELLLRSTLAKGASAIKCGYVAVRSTLCVLESETSSTEVQDHRRVRTTELRGYQAVNIYYARTAHLIIRNPNANPI